MEDAVARKTDRVEARLSPEERQRIDQAAQLAGQSLSAFMVGAAVEKADQVIADIAVTVVPPDYFDRLVAEIDKADPAPQLARAVARARRSRLIR